MPFGSIFSKFEYVNLTTADGNKINLKNTPVSRLALSLIGIPHMGLRLRSRIILKNIPKNAKRMLDAGCGSGVYSFSLAKKAKFIEAVDISKEKIRYLQSVNPFQNIKFHQGDLCNLKFKEKSFDFIICSDVLEHIKDDEKAFSEISRVLDKNGTLILTVPYYSEKNKRDYKKFEHEREGYTLKRVKQLADKHGLIIEKSVGYSFPATEELSKLNYKIINNRFLLGLLFYPIYLLALLSEKIARTGEPDGLFVKLKKL